MASLRLTIPVVFVALSLVGCSKADRASTTPPAQGATEEPSTAEGEHHDHDHDFSGPVVTFHDTMAPLWHADAGEARTTDTCAAAGDLIAKAEMIASEAAPEKVTDPEAWSAASRDLVAAAQLLEVTCADSPDEFDGTFKGLHEAFHALVKLAGHDEQ